jgi:hypothetical protein
MSFKYVRFIVILYTYLCSFVLQKYDIDRDRLDVVYHRLLQGSEEFSSLWKVVRKVLVLFHGQAQVEGGFSINKDMLVENLKEQSLIALRVVILFFCLSFNESVFTFLNQVYNAITYYGGVLNVPLTQELLQSVKLASQRRKLALEKKRESETAQRSVAKRNAELDGELLQVEQAKAKLSEQITELEEKAALIKRQKTINL